MTKIERAVLTAIVVLSLLALAVSATAVTAQDSVETDSSEGVDFTDSDQAQMVELDTPSTVHPDGEFDFTVTMTDSAAGEVAVESDDFGVELSVVDDDGDSIASQSDTSVEFLDIDADNSTYTLNVDVTGGEEGDEGTITAATGGNIGDDSVDDQQSTGFTVFEVPDNDLIEFSGVPDEVSSGTGFDFTVETVQSSVAEVAVRSDDFTPGLSVVDDDGDSLGAQSDTSVEFIDIDADNSTYTLSVDVGDASPGETGEVVAAVGGNIGEVVDDQQSMSFSIVEAQSPIDGFDDDLWVAVTSQDGDTNELSLQDLGGAISAYQDSPGDATVGGEPISLQNLGELIGYYQSEVA